MTLRTAKMLLVFAVAVFYSLLVLNNTTDYDSNYQFVRHVLMMDSTFPNNRGMWRALNSPAWHTSFYLSIIAWEIVTMILCWWGGVNLARSLRGTSQAFNQSKRVAIAALTCAILMWLVAFLSIGGVVSDVAVEELEWPGGGFPHVHRHRYRVIVPGPTRKRYPTLAFSDGGHFPASAKCEPQQARN